LKKALEFEEKIGYTFKSKELLLQALTHSSFAHEHKMGPGGDNERLEFLGDAVLEICSSDFLFHEFPKKPEGELTRLRASLVCEPTLAYCTEEIQLGDYVRLGKGEDLTGGRKRPSILSDALEAVIGAIYLDGGMEPAEQFIKRFILSDIEHKRLFSDSKSSLQELVQGKELGKLSYHLIEESGPAHNRQFVVEARLDQKVIGKGIGSSKKRAEQQAAYEGIKTLGGR